jgi:ureidoglycolate dehydrogenase (NAD+)
MSFEAAQGEETVGTRPKRAPADRIEEFATAVLIAAGTDPAVARSVAGALTETSLRGVDSHGIRLLMHYAKVVQAGRINSRPRLTFTRTDRSTGIVDADNGFGHHASYFAINHAVTLAQFLLRTRPCKYPNRNITLSRRKQECVFFPMNTLGTARSS